MVKIEELKALALSVKEWPPRPRFPHPAFQFQKTCTPAVIIQIINRYEAVVAAGKLFTDAMDDCMNYPDTSAEREALIEAAKAMDAALTGVQQ